MITDNLDVIPEDIYQRLIDQADSVEFSAANGGDYAIEFPPYLSSVTALRSAHLRLGGKEQYGQFPYHRFLLGSAAPFVVPQIMHYYGRREILSLNKFFISFAANANALREFYSPDSQTSATIRDMVAQEFDSLGRLATTIGQMPWLNGNINQQHRAAQVAYVADNLQERLVYAASLLNEFCFRRRLKWSIRPPIAFHSPHSESLMSRSDLTGLHDMSYLISPAMAYVLDSTPYGLQQLLYGPDRYEGKDYAAQFRFWHHRAAYGLIWTPAAGDTQGFNAWEAGLIALGTPAALYSKYDFGVPLYVREPDSGLSPWDTHARVVYGSEHSPPSRFDMDAVSDSALTTAMAVLNYIALSYSIFVATIPMGKGNHKPSWTRSPLNIPLIRALHAIQSPLLSRFERLLK